QGLREKALVEDNDGVSVPVTMFHPQRRLSIISRTTASGNSGVSKQEVDVEVVKPKSPSSRK
ncbi:unnamed protein product, partial [Polarella glacialis]